jgi:hypothetical protein
MLMGVRLYNPRTGRFLSLDPVVGANQNAYAYPVDPINSIDPSGLRPAPTGDSKRCKDSGWRTTYDSGWHKPRWKFKDTLYFPTRVPWKRLGKHRKERLRDQIKQLAGIVDVDWYDRVKTRLRIRCKCKNGVQTVETTKWTQLDERYVVHFPRFDFTYYEHGFVRQRYKRYTTYRT